MIISILGEKNQLCMSEYGHEKIPVFSDESLEDLQRSGYRMLQKKQGFRFGSDSVLLAAYAAQIFEKTPDRPLFIADLGAGCGAVSLLLAARLHRAQIIGVEKDCPSCNVLMRNSLINNLEQRLHVLAADIAVFDQYKHLPQDLPDFNQYDLVVTNPPFLKPEQSYSSGAGSAAAEKRAVWESELSLADVLYAASRLLKPGGWLTMVHRPHRLTDVFSRLRDYKLEPVHLCLVQPLPQRPPSAFLLKARFTGKPGGLHVDAPLILWDQPGQMNSRAAEMYGNEPAMELSQLWHNLLPVSPCTQAAISTEE